MFSLHITATGQDDYFDVICTCGCGINFEAHAAELPDEVARLTARHSETAWLEAKFAR